MLTEIHGEHPTTRGLILIYTGGITGTVLVLGAMWVQAVDYSPLQWLVLALVTLDVIAGAIANMTVSTNRYYRNHAPRVSWLFLAVHIAHPALLGWFLDAEHLLQWVAVYMYALIAGLIVLSQADTPEQKPLAALLVVVGIVLTQTVLDLSPMLTWFTPIYLLKLVGAFAVTHYPNQTEGLYE